MLGLLGLVLGGAALGLSWPAGWNVGVGRYSRANAYANAGILCMLMALFCAFAQGVQEGQKHTTAPAAALEEQP